MVKSLLSLLSTRQSTILSGAAILMIAVFASKILGLIRNRLLVHKFDTATTDIFFAAFSLPDLLFQLLIFGALSVAFIPLFTDYLNHKGEEDAFKFASNILNLSLLVFGIVAILAFIFVPTLNSILIPGFSGEQKIITDHLSRLILFSQILLVIGSFFIAMAQSYQRFIVPALAPIVYNIGTILGIVFLSPMFGIAGPAMGIILGAALHVLIQLPLIYSLGFKFSLAIDIAGSGIREMIRLVSFRNIGLAFEQIGDKVAVALASLIIYPSITILTFAQQLHTLPVSLFGLTIAQAALPILSREQSRKEIGAFKITLLTTMHQILFLTLPIAAILIVLRIPVVRLAFGASQFNWADTVLTGRTAAFFALGLVAQSVILLLIRGFYAFKDTKTPSLISVIAVIVNITCGFIFIRVLNLEVWGLGLAYAISNNLTLILLLYFLNKKVGGLDKNKLAMPALKMLLAALVAAIALYIPIKALDQLVFDTTRTVNLIILTGIASVFGLSIYLLLVWLMQVKELTTFAELVKRMAKVQSKIVTKEIIDEPGTL